MDYKIRYISDKNIKKYFNETAFQSIRFPSYPIKIKDLINGEIGIIYNTRYVAIGKKKYCEYCNKVMIKPPEYTYKRWAISRFCSHICAARIIHKGQKPWCTGKKLSEEHKKKLSIAHKGKHYSRKTEIKKGQRLSPKTEFKKGNIPWNWKGDDVGYGALHKWVSNKLGKAIKCERCGIEDKKCSCCGQYKNNIHWANISGKYKRELNDWQQMCINCHSDYDYKLGRRKHNV